ncbi:GNAT family N-acetyltransferase [Streptomyces xinghaiensis]|uniref:GNAT family N-acetyltransferase n=1 Tax=Streptomyces xinghaiensis TaxID=1038928 RepID=UPI0034158516
MAARPPHRFPAARPGAEPSADWWRRHHQPGRFLGAWDGERCVGTFRSIPMELTVPGGAVLPADGIADVTVTSTHRRRGLLTRMMRHDLALARERGDVFALLTAAEYGSTAAEPWCPDRF